MKFQDHSIKVSLLTLCILLAVIISQVFTTTPVSAATIIVNSTADVIADDGYCTLREAIIAANSDTASGAVPGECAAGSGTDEITLPADIYTLTSQLPDIASDITINGADVATTIIQASTCDPTLPPGSCTPASYRILTVNKNRALNLNQVTLQYGAGITYGGAIYNYGILTIVNSIITSNTVTDSGGGIYNSSNEGTLIVEDSEISGNLAQNHGGGIMNYGKLTLTGSTIINNDATAHGGGIYNGKSGETDIPAITGCLISGNTAGSSGGGIRNLYGINITDSTISANTAGTNGGGIFNLGTMNINNGVVSENLAENNGGGVYNTSGTITLTNITSIQGNSVQGWGGGIYNTSSGSVVINNGRITTNISKVYAGGGIFNQGTMNIDNSVVSDNIAEQNFGGGIHNIGSLSVSTTTLSGNSAAASGGGISSASSVTAYVSESNLYQNHAKINGGGIFNNGSMILAASTLLENRADSNGGGIFNQSILSVINSTFSVNHAVNFGGGAANYFDLSLTNCTFYGNTAESVGGGVYNFASGSLQFANTILFNSEKKDCVNEPGGSIALNTHNLVEANHDPPNDCGIPYLTANPQLAALGDNGGPTQTYAIIDNSSPVFDAGDLFLCPKTDQRGVIRPQDWGCDIGAFELEGVRHPVSLTVNIEPLDTGEVSKTPDAPYFFGDEVTLSAIAEPDWAFDSWSGDASSTANPLIIRIQDDTIITANFIESLSNIFLPLILR